MNYNGCCGPSLSISALGARSLMSAAIMTVLWPSPKVQAAGEVQTHVAAVYSISFAGFDIGHFRFNSRVGRKTYELTSDSKVKLLFGAFKWNSQSRTSGTGRSKPTPVSFDFNYKIKKKQKLTSVRFAGNKVIKRKVTPRVNYSAEHVRLLPKHLVGVIDPMTAIMRMTQVAKGNPCRQKSEVFDGRRRMRLTLRPKGKRRVEERNRSGQPAFGYVCQIRFTPIAGHKKTNQIRYIANNKDMEIVLRPVPSANLVVPYQILIPTMFGTVSVSARSINIDNGRKKRIAMKY